jgi:hypothetical protein
MRQQKHRALLMRKARQVIGTQKLWAFAIGFRAVVKHCNNLARHNRQKQ